MSVLVVPNVDAIRQIIVVRSHSTYENICRTLSTSFQ